MRDVRAVVIGSSIVAVAAMISLSGCNKTAAAGCSSSDATSVTTDLLKESLEKAVYARIHDSDAGGSISRANIRAAVAQLALMLEDVRTAREDPNSTKRFCEGTLKIRFPAEALNNAEDARSDKGLGSITQLADASNVDRQADSLSASLQYDVQPTDDGQKVFSETDTGTPILTVAAEVLASSLMKPALQQSALQAQQAEQAQQAVQNAALAQQKAANLNAAKTDDQLAAQSILAVWRALAPDVRGRLLPQQRVWSAKKDADCKVEAASASTDPNEVEVARLNCDARETQSRLSSLQQLRTQAPSAEAPSRQGETDF